MKKIEIPVAVLEFMFQWDRIVYINDDNGWGAESEVGGFTREGVMEGHKLVAENGAEFEPQYAYLRRANHLKAGLDERVNGSWERKETVMFSELSLCRNFDVVVQTSNETLSAIAPVLETKTEVVAFLSAVNSYFAELKASGAEMHYDRLRYVEELTIFLYKNNPNKREEPSFLDRL